MAQPNPRNFAAILGLMHNVGRAFDGQPGLNIPYLLLYALGAINDNPAVSELARTAHVTLKTASRVLRSLSRRGWVTTHQR